MFDIQASYMAKQWRAIWLPRAVLLFSSEGMPVTGTQGQNCTAKKGVGPAAMA
jgi:hypothetical protein